MNKEDFVIDNKVLVMYNGKDTDITLPDEVIWVANGAFEGDYNHTGIKSIVMPNVVEIGDYAFYGVKTLESVTAPSLKEVGNSAFSHCSYLKEFNAPVLATVNEGAFQGCEKLTDIDFAPLHVVDSSAFKDCISLTKVELPNVKRICGMAFTECTSLKSIVAVSATSIDGYAFKGCTSLVNANIPIAKIIGGGAFKGCCSLESIELNAAVTIKDEAFACCSSLTRFCAPAVATFGDYVFVNDTALTSADFDFTAKMGERVFCNTPVELIVMQRIEFYRSELEREAKKLKQSLGTEFTTKTEKVSVKITAKHALLAVLRYRNKATLDEVVNIAERATEWLKTNEPSISVLNLVTAESIEDVCREYPDMMILLDNKVSFAHFYGYTPLKERQEVEKRMEWDTLLPAVKDAFIRVL